MEKRRILENLGFVGTVIENGKPIIEIENRERIVIANHKGIVFMSADKIVLRLTEGSVTIGGNNLMMDAFSSSGAVISGSLQYLEFAE